MRLAPVLVTAVAVAVAGAEAAGAAAPWSEPQVTTGGLTRISYDGAGHGTLSGFVRPDLVGSQVIAVPLQGGAVGPTLESPSSLNLLRLLVYGGHRVVAAGDLPGDPPLVPRAALSRGVLGAPLGRPRSLRGRSRRASLLDLAVNEAGDAVAVVRWRETLVLFRWPRGGRLQGPRRIARGRRLGAGVATNTRGDALIVWDRLQKGRRGGRRDVYAQLLTASGRLRPPRRLGAAPTAPRYHLALADDRRAVAAWVAQPVSECFANRGEIAVAQADANARFGRPHRLARLLITGCGRYADGPGVAFGRLPDGRVVIAWSGNEGTRWVVRAGELGPAGVTGASVVSDRATDAVLADLAVGPRGEVVVLLADGVGGADATGPARLLAVTRGPGSAAYGAPELIADGAGVGSALAIDPASNRPTAIYPSVAADFTPRTAVVSRDPVG